MSCPDITRIDGTLIHQIATDVGCVPNDPLLFVQKFYGVGLGVLGGIAMIVIIFGGYLLITSRGNIAQVKKGKEYILYAVISLLLAIFGFVFLEAVAVNLFHIPGIGA